MTEVYYQRYGEAQQALVLLHSGGMAGVEWRPQIKTLATRYRVLVPDLPGHGKTLLPDDSLTITKMAQAVLTMMDKEQIERAHFCGSSMGGAVTMWLSVHHPQRVDKAVFYRMSYQKNQSTYEQTRLMASPAYWQQYGLHQWLSKLHQPQGGTEAWKRVIERVSEAFDPQSSQHHHDLQTLARINKPVLIIGGDRDPVAPLADLIAMHQAMPQSGLWILPYATHITGSNAWRAEIFAEELKRFFSRQ